MIAIKTGSNLKPMKHKSKLSSNNHANLRQYSFYKHNLKQAYIKGNDITIFSRHSHHHRI